MTQPPVTSVAQCLEADHRTLDAGLVDCERLARSRNFPDASKLFAVFASGLTRHMELEERLLFPELESAEPRAKAPTSVMRAEHQALRQLLVDIAYELGASSSGWQSLVLLLRDLLVAHNTKEERVLYPMADEVARRAGAGGGLADRLRVELTPVA